MIGEEIPHALYIFIIIYAIIILAIAIFIQLYFTRKGTSLFLNIISIFLWFTMLLVILLFPLDLFSGSLFGDDEDNAHRMEILSAFLYWNFYICGFLIIDQIKGYNKWQFYCHLKNSFLSKIHGCFYDIFRWNRYGIRLDI